MDDALASCVSHAGPVGCVPTRFDVFLSFPGGSDAAPESFPSRLLASLAAAGISVSGPNESQAVRSSSELPDEAARRCKICVPILSEDYPSSERCLRRLVHMMEGKRSGLQMVFPIFNRVDPSHVRYLIGSYEKARHSDIEGVQRALEEVSLLHGWKVTDGREEELVKTVVQTILRGLRPNFYKVFKIVKYNVFLNFRGTDTRSGIAYHIYNSLVAAGVSVFKDDTNLPIGEEFGSQLLNAITRSTIYITILSPNYASSKWCLHELAKMTDCMRSKGHLVIPIFYGVQPHEVRHLKGNFGAAFHSRDKSHRLADAAREGPRLLQQRHVLTSVATLKGWEPDKLRSDGKLIQAVVQDVLRQLRHHFQLDVPEHLVRK